MVRSRPAAQSPVKVFVIQGIVIRDAEGFAGDAFRRRAQFLLALHELEREAVVRLRLKIFSKF